MKIKYNRPTVKIDDNSAKEIADMLNHLLANEYAFFTKTLNYHWNVTGPRFHSLHNFLEDQYKSLLDVMDEIAERVRILGETPLSTVKNLHAEMNLREINGKDLSASEMLTDLFNDGCLIQESLKDAVADEKLLKNDPGTEDFLVSILQKHEMLNWMLKSHLD